MMVSVFKPKKSIFKSPASSTTELSNCVTNLLAKWPKHEENVPIRTGEGIQIHIWDKQQPKPPIQKQAEESDSCGIQRVPLI